jgi:molybdate transport system substrate-binding protein
MGTDMSMNHRLRWCVGALLRLAAACGGGGDDDDSAAPTGSAEAEEPTGSITVFAAASLSDAFGEMASTFEEENPGTTVELNFGASSALREQILAGAPADVFASANTSNMDQLVDADAVEGEPEMFAKNELEIAVPAGNPGDVHGLDAFGHADLDIGLCAEEVPCGQFGREALASAGVTPAQDTDEPDVRSLLTKVEAGDLDAGLVYHTDVLAAGDEVEGVQVPDEFNVIAEYPLAALSASGHAELATAFVEFVLSDEGQDILESYGFMPG